MKNISLKDENYNSKYKVFSTSSYVGILTRIANYMTQ